MPSLNMLINQLSIDDDVKAAIADILHIEFNRLCVDSRQVAVGDVFVLLQSQNPKATIDYTKIQNHLDEVAGKAIFVLSQIPQDKLKTDLPFVYLPNIRQFLGDWVKISLQIHQPVKLPTLIATTGTNGKTTISQLIAQLIAHSGKMTAVMGTAGNGVLPNLSPASHTTLEVMQLHQAVYDFAQQGVQALSLEASSHGLDQYRLQGLPLAIAVFSNLSRDHLDYHHDMNDYAATKAKLFDKAYFDTLTHAIINADDEFGEQMITVARASDLIVWTYSLIECGADFFAKNIQPSLDGVELDITTPQGDIHVKSPLLGRFNVANLLASVAAGLAYGLSLDEIEKAIPKLVGATGRMDRVPSRTGSFIVDYAHTPDALEQVLMSLRFHCTGDLWVVFGCGGDRDRGKRPLMTQVALKWADKVVLTADNPRSEDPLVILKEMQVGMRCDDHYKTHIEPERKLAIAYAVNHAKANDIVVVAGKGHETYQEINGVRYDFDDKAILVQMIEKFDK